MRDSIQQPVNITMTCQELIDLAACSCRMTGYADPDGARLISVVHSQKEIPVRLVLDRKCIGCSCVNNRDPCKKQNQGKKNKTTVFSMRRM